MTTPPADWLKRAASLIGTVTLEVAGYATPVAITVEALQRAYLPLLAILNEQARSRRVLAGLVGVPGSGKSTYAAAMTLLADRLLGEGVFAAVGIDGWHLPNAVLDRRTTSDATGQTIPLRQRKGGPESFDVPALADALTRLKADAGPVNLPAYDRRLHEPVPDRVLISPRTRIVLVEGNYLLGIAAGEPSRQGRQNPPALQEECPAETPTWNTIAAMLSPRFLLVCDPANARLRVIERHVRGGCSRQEAERKYEHNDGLNARIVLTAAHRADWIVELHPPALLAKT